MSLYELKDRINYGNIKEGIFRLYEREDFVYILFSRQDEMDVEDNIIVLKIIDLDTEEEYETEIIDFSIEDLDKINLGLYFLDNYFYFFYQDNEKFFALKYALEINTINMYDLNDIGEELYIVYLVKNVKFDIIQNNDKIYFFYIEEEENKYIHIYEITTSDYNLVSKIELQKEETTNFILQLMDYDKLFLLNLDESYYYIIENGDFIKREELNIDLSICKSINKYGDFGNNIGFNNDNNTNEYCIKSYNNNLYFLKMDTNRSYLDTITDGTEVEEGENLILKINKEEINNLSNLILYNLDGEILEVLSNINIDNIRIYQYALYDNYLLIVYTDEYKNIDKIYNMKKVKVINLNNNIHYDYQHKFEYCFIYNKNLIFVNHRTYDKSSSLVIKYYILTNKKLDKEDIIDLGADNEFISLPNVGNNYYFFKRSNLLDMENSRSLRGTEEYCLCTYNLKDYNYEEGYIYNPVISSRAVTNLTDTTETTFSSGEYKFGEYTKSTDLSIGLGTYLFTDISKDNPISFNITNKSNIEFLGLTNNMFMVGDNDDNRKYPYTYMDSNNNLFYFYYGTVALKVTGDFGSINGYYVYYNSSVSTVNHKISFDNSNIAGKSIDNCLELNEITTNRLNTNFYHTGNKTNGIEVICNNPNATYTNTSTDTDTAITYFPYVHSYTDITESTCMYIRSNGIPNYKIYIDGTVNTTSTAKWASNKSITSGLIETNINGIDRQSYSYVNNSRKVYGYPFKIPTNPDIVEEKTIPVKIYSIEETPTTTFNKEVFWYKNDSNWKEVMTDRSYETIKIGTGPSSLTPLGPIGIMVNGIPCYNHHDMTDTVSDIVESSVSKITDPVVKRQLTTVTLNSNYNRTNRVTDTDSTNSKIVYDNNGGTIDRNNDYHYNKYPVGLEAMIKFGTVISETNNPYYGEAFKTEYDIGTNGIILDKYYFNVSEGNFSGYTFSLTKGSGSLSEDNLTLLQNNFYTNGLPGKSLNAHLYLDLSVVTVTEDYIGKTFTLQGKKGSDTLTKIIKIIESPVHSDDKKYFYLKKDSSKIDFYKTPTVNGFTYTGFLKNIGLTDSTNEIKLALEAQKSFEGNSADSQNTFAHSPILGWAFDGYPIYGQIGYAKDTDGDYSLKILKSSYDTSTHLYDQNGTSGDLDICNGIFRKTPEYPDGIYHYVCTLNTDGTEIDVSKAKIEDNSIYAYPYIIGAYRGVPELSNFALTSTTNASLSSNSSSSTYSTSVTSTDSTSTSSTSSGTSSQLIVSDTTNYDVNFRSIKGLSDTYNGTATTSLNVTQDENYIKLQRGTKPYIWNFTGSSTTDTYFGADCNMFGLGTIASLADSGSSPSFLKAYGTVMKFKYTGTVTIGKVAIFDSDTDLTVKDLDENKSILGVIIYKDTTNNLCYVSTNGICEVETITNTPVKNEVLSSSTAGVIKKYSIDGSNDDTINYILGTYIGQNSSANYLININPHTVLD
tara:strand:- start:6702 stop:11090 length:4389 start_codon:yes stop_codon:yes gene_type:complete